MRLLLNFMFGERRFHKCEASVWAFDDAEFAARHPYPSEI